MVHFQGNENYAAFRIVLGKAEDEPSFFGHKACQTTF
jgi:hypothetical protein